MPKVDFFVLETESAQKSWFFACGLVEKYYAAQQKIYLHTETAAEAERLDALLWTFKEDSFLPHTIYQAGEVNPPAIQIGYQESVPSHHDVLINLCTTVPSFAKQFEHIIEIVFTEPLVQQLARERYRHYRDSGFTLNTHKLKAHQA